MKCSCLQILEVFAFSLPGARKLYRKGINLLGGRARIQYLHPFSAWELKDEFDLTKALSVGTLPSIWFSDKSYEDLADYAGMLSDIERYPDWL